MSRYLLSFVFLISYGIAYSAPSDEDILKEISNNISEEYITCGSFFGIVSGGSKKSKKFDIATDYQKAMERALTQALMSAEIGRTKEMAQKVTLARFEMTMTEMMESIDSDYSNISLLLNKHAKRCRWVMENTDKFMTEWQKNIFNKYGVTQ